MDAKTVEQHLKSADLETVIPTTLANWENADKAQIAEVTEWVCGIRDEFIALVHDVDDSEQIIASIAIHYIEIKSHWIALNTKMNYQMARNGAAETPIVLRGAAVSAFLATLEPLIQPGDVDAITSFLAEPINPANWQEGDAATTAAA